jgi:hypothetical protein
VLFIDRVVRYDTRPSINNNNNNNNNNNIIIIIIIIIAAYTLENGVIS